MSAEGTAIHSGEDPDLSEAGEATVADHDLGLVNDPVDDVAWVIDGAENQVPA